MSKNTRKKERSIKKQDAVISVVSVTATASIGNIESIYAVGINRIHRTQQQGLGEFTKMQMRPNFWALGLHPRWLK